MAVGIQVEDDRAQRIVLTRDQATLIVDALEQEDSPASLALAQAIRERDEEDLFAQVSGGPPANQDARDEQLEWFEAARDDPLGPAGEQLDALYRAFARLQQLKDAGRL